MFRKFLIALGILALVLGGIFLYYKDTILGTVEFAKQTKETVSTVSGVNKRLPALIQEAKDNHKNGSDSTVTTDKSAEKQIKEELVTVKQELKKLTETEPPAKLKKIHEKLAAHSDEANMKIDEYIKQIDNGTFNPEEFQALYEEMKDSPEFKEAEKYLKLLQ